MDFKLSDEQRAIKDAAREFAEGEFPLVAKDCDRKETFLGCRDRRIIVNRWILDKNIFCCYDFK